LKLNNSMETTITIEEQVAQLAQQLVAAQTQINTLNTEVQANRPNNIRVVSDANGRIGYIPPKENTVIWEREEIIPPPVNPINIGTQNHKAQLGYHTWLYPFERAFPGGTYALSNAIVSRDQKYGAWSQETVVTIKSGSRFYGSCWNQPSRTDDVGIVWKVRCIDIPNPVPGFIETGAVFSIYPQLYFHDQIAPYDWATPNLKFLGTLTWWNHRFNLLRSGGRATVVAPAPTVVCVDIPNAPFQISYCRVTETGETELAPPLSFTPSDEPANFEKDEVICFQTWENEPHPQGCIGLHYYIKFGADVEGGGVWRRLPPEHCFGTPVTADDWLSPIQKLQVFHKRYLPNAPIHQAVPVPKTLVTGLHLALKERGESIVIEVPEIKIRCPIIDEWGYGPFGTWNTPPKINNRTITTKDGAKCSITQANGLQSTYWPMLMIYNQYSTWENVTCSGSCLAGLVYSDYSGGQAFGNKFFNCNFYANPHPSGLTCGVIVDYDQSGSGHTASEQYFEGCRIGGDIGLYYAGNQSANWRMHYTHMNGGSRYGRRHCAMYADTNNQISFTGGLFFDSADSIFKAYGLGLNIQIDYFWVDQGFTNFISAGNCGVIFKASGGKLNCWGNDGGIPNLANLMDCYTASISMHNVVTQGANELRVSNHRPRCVELAFDNTLLSKIVVLQQPDGTQYEAEYRRYYGGPYTKGYPEDPGYRLGLPAAKGKTDPVVVKIKATEEQITIPSLVVNMPASEVVYNSLTTGKKVKKLNWYN